MRVAAVVPTYPPSSRAGAWLATHELMRYLVARGHEVTAFAQLLDIRAYQLDGVTVETGIRGRSHSVHVAADADVVVSHCGDDGIGADAARRAGKPSVRIGHGPPVTGIDDAALIVFNSHALQQATPHDRPSIVVTPYTDPSRYATTPGDLITLVNLCDHKGGRLFERIVRSMPDRQFLGVRGYSTQIVPRHANVEVIANTANMRDDVYGRSRIVLMPSLRETWGMVGIEAMCSGIPVIANPTPGLRESLGEAGIFVDRDDAHGWMEAIERLDDAGEYELASKRGFARVDQLEDDRERFALAVEALCA